MNIIRITALVLLSAMLAPLNAIAHCAGKHNGNHAHCTGGDPPSDEYTSPNNDVQFIPNGAIGFDYHIIGTPDRDDIIAGSGRDLIESGGARDFIWARGNDDEIYGGDGSDILYGEDGDDILFGEADGDTLQGGPGTDYLLGGDGDDVLKFSLGQFNGTAYEVDIYDGGDEIIGDHISFDTQEIGLSISGVTIDLANATYEANINDPVLGPIVVSGSFVNIEGAWGSAGDDTIHGTAGFDPWLAGGSGNDILIGYDGPDWLNDGPGDDVLDGGAGNDNIAATSGSDVVFGGPGNDEIASENDEASDEISGGPGCDLLLFKRKFGVDTVTDFEDGCDLIVLSSYNPTHRADFNDLAITVSGTDILIDFWFKKHGGAGGTIIIKDGVTNNIAIDPSDFVF